MLNASGDQAMAGSVDQVHGHFMNKLGGLSMSSKTPRAQERRNITMASIGGVQGRSCPYRYASSLIPEV